MDLTGDRKCCAVCQSPAKQICGGCGNIYYCAKEHQKLHWTTHKLECKPYKIFSNEKVGRYMVASRNLKAGDIIFRSKALVTGPKQGTHPICLTCYADVQQATAFQCPICKFPFCAEKCAKNPLHAIECPILSRASGRITIEDYTKTHPVYECITPLRCLLLKDNLKDFEAFQELQNHNESRRGNDLWRVNQVNVVNFLRQVCQLEERFSEEDIHSVCGILEVNAFEIKTTLSGNRIQGIFPLAAMMAHSCISNMSHVIDDDNQMVTRASVPILKGQPIYMNYTLSLQGTKERRATLRQGKFFECDCARCSDPSECWTYLSAFKCLKCSAGNVLALKPLEEDSQWGCDRCDYRLTAAVVDRVTKRLKQEFEAIGSNDVKAFEAFLQRHASLLHPNHYFFTDARHSLSQLYGRDEQYLLNNLSESQLERKAEICRQLLAVADVLEPGISRLRGVTLYEMHAPLILLAKQKYEKNQISVDDFKERLRSVRKILEEALLILSMEAPTSPEGIMGKAAQTALNQMQNLMTTV